MCCLSSVNLSVRYSDYNEFIIALRLKLKIMISPPYLRQISYSRASVTSSIIGSLCNWMIAREEPFIGFEELGRAVLAVLLNFAFSSSNCQFFCSRYW